MIAGGDQRGTTFGAYEVSIGYCDIERYGPNAPWQQPELNNQALPDAFYPRLKRIDVPATAELGVAIDGSEKWWPAEPGPAVLPTFSPYQSQPGQYLEVFNRGSVPFDYTVSVDVPWLKVSRTSGRVDDQVRVDVRVDWRRVPTGSTTVPITVTCPDGASVVVRGTVENPRGLRPKGHVEANGYVSIPAAHHTRAVRSGGVHWKRLPDLGRTGDGLTPFPVTAASRTPGGDSPRLEYEPTLTTTGPVRVSAYCRPRNNVLPTDRLKYAVSIDDGSPDMINVTTGTGANDTSMNRQWERNTSDNVNVTTIIP